VALAHPGWFNWFRGDFITWRLAVIMPGKGITLSVDDFRAVLKTPLPGYSGYIPFAPELFASKNLPWPRAPELEL
jgi:predicted Na+-dependent transporter